MSEWWNAIIIGFEFRMKMKRISSLRYLQTTIHLFIFAHFQMHLRIWFSASSVQAGGRCLLQESVWERGCLCAQRRTRLWVSLWTIHLFQNRINVILAWLYSLDENRSLVVTASTAQKAFCVRMSSILVLLSVCLSLLAICVKVQIFTSIIKAYFFWLELLACVRSFVVLVPVLGLLLEFNLLENSKWSLSGESICQFGVCRNSLLWTRGFECLCHYGYRGINCQIELTLGEKIVDAFSVGNFRYLFSFVRRAVIKLKLLHFELAIFLRNSLELGVLVKF